MGAASTGDEDWRTLKLSNPPAAPSYPRAPAPPPARPKLTTSYSFSSSTTASASNSVDPLSRESFLKCQQLLEDAANERERQRGTLLRFRDAFRQWVALWFDSETGLERAEATWHEWKPKLSKLLQLCIESGLVTTLDVIHDYAPIGLLREARPDWQEEERDMIKDALRGYKPRDCPGYSEYTHCQMVRVLTAHGWHNPHTSPGRKEVIVDGKAYEVYVLAEMAYYAQLQEKKQADLLDQKDLLLPELERTIRLPFANIGHAEVACRMAEIIVRHFGLRTRSSRRPLVILLGGPSGHGKTSLAHALADLVSREPLDTHFLKVSCGSTQTAAELFGLSGAYQGAETHSELNKFVVENKNRPGVVLLDEFEKLRLDAQEGFLECFDTGTWVDKCLDRHASSQTRRVGSSNLIFMLTTNVPLEEGASVDELRAQLPFTDELIGRISDILPFPRFKKEEKLLVVQHCLFEECAELAHGKGDMHPKVWGNLRGVLDHRRITYNPEGLLPETVLESCRLLIDTLGVHEVQCKASMLIKDQLIALFRRIKKQQAGQQAAPTSAHAAPVLAKWQPVPQKVVKLEVTQHGATSGSGSKTVSAVLLPHGDTRAQPGT